jgi:Xylose isomerase-like TIM barrel
VTASWGGGNFDLVNSPLTTEMAPPLGHHPVGASTGYMVGSRGDWPRLLDEASRVSSFAVELTALREDELPGLLKYLSDAPTLPFRYVSVHGPSKARQMPEEELAALLAELPPFVSAIVLHPDQIGDPRLYARLGSRLVIENMDSRKTSGQTSEDLAQLFEVLPEAGFCFDVAHAWTVDRTMKTGEELLDRFASRLRHVHLSSMSDDLGHVPLSFEQEKLFAPLLGRCRDVPWILEAEPR